MKKDHYQQHRNYKDLDGNMKTFTVIDHDKHTSRTQSGREYKEQENLTETLEERLVSDIYASGMNRHPFFIREYDTILSQKYSFNRLKEGKTVENLIDDTKSPEWYTDLETLYKKTLLANIAELQAYLKVQYDL